MTTAPLNDSLGRDRVRAHTPLHINQRIDLLTNAWVDGCVEAGPDAIERRLLDLELEWDVDRALIVNFAVAGSLAFALGMTRYVRTPWYARRRKGFLYLLGAQLGFLLLHGTAGWCPPASLFRRLGFRTQREIESERAQLRDALKLLSPLG